MIDLGTALVDPAPTILTIDEIGSAAAHHDLPVVLDVPPCEETSPDGPTPEDPTKMRRLTTLARPDWLLAVRKYADTDIDRPHIDRPHIERLCIAGTGAAAAVVATRRPDAVALRDLLGDPAAPVLELLGSCPAMQFDAVNLPTDELARLVDAPPSAPEPALMLATALRHTLSHTQIVGIARGTQFDEHLTVFDTAGGRVLVTSSPAADGTRWSSLTSGTTARIGQAVRDLVERTRRFSRSGCPAPG